MTRINIHALADQLETMADEREPLTLDDMRTLAAALRGHADAVVDAAAAVAELAGADITRPSGRVVSITQVRRIGPAFRERAL